MSKNIQKAAYIFALSAVIVTALLGFSTIASAQSYDGYWDGSYDDYYDYDDGYYDQPTNWYDYDDGWDDYSYYGDDGYYNDYYGYGNCNGCSNGYDDYYDYDNYYGNSCNNCYDYSYDDYDACSYYDCYSYDTCGSACSTGSNDTIIDIWNNNVNTNTNTIITYADNYDDNDDNDNDDDDDEDFDVMCIPSDDEVEEGDRVTFRARIRGVDEDDVDFEWSGDIDGDDQEVSRRFNNDGTYRVRVEAEYRGDIETDTCTIEVEDEDNDRDNNRITLVSNPPTGTPASLNSVYLSQVPYTGASDKAKILGFITILGLMSVGLAYYIVTRKVRGDRKSFIEAFKAQNFANKA